MGDFVGLMKFSGQTNRLVVPDGREVCFNRLCVSWHSRFAVLGVTGQAEYDTHQFYPQINSHFSRLRRAGDGKQKPRDKEIKRPNGRLPERR